MATDEGLSVLATRRFWIECYEWNVQRLVAFLDRLAGDA